MFTEAETAERLFRQGGVVVRRASGERIQVWSSEANTKKRLVLKLLLSKDMAYCSPFNDIVKSPVKGPCEEDGWTAGAILPQLKLRVC